MRETRDLCDFAEQQFGYLVEEHGFVAQRDCCNAVSFSILYQAQDGRRVSVGAFLPRYEYSVALTMTPNLRSFDLGELVAVVDPSYSYDLGPAWGWAHSDSATFKKHISHSADLLRRYGQRFLDSDSSLWDEVSLRRTVVSAAYAQNEQDNQIREKADDAFKKADWSMVIALYESLSVNLTPVEAKRLAMAHGRLGTPTPPAAG